jgi:hypothetical protein
MTRKPEPKIVQVQPSNDGFVANWGGDRVAELKWSEVERVFTYKVDCFGYDMIWLAFERHGHDEAIHIPEEAEGFENLMSAIGKTFPEINPEWYLMVMQPPFAETLTILFERRPKV